VIVKYTSGRDRIDMPHERRKLHEIVSRIAAISIPSKQATDREAVAQVMEMWRRSAPGNSDVQLRDQGMEYEADRTWVHGRPPMNENTGASGGIPGVRSALMLMKP
jgi:hypothetical protein